MPLHRLGTTEQLMALAVATAHAAHGLAHSAVADEAAFGNTTPAAAHRLGVAHAAADGAVEVAHGLAADAVLGRNALAKASGAVVAVAVGVQGMHE